MSGRQLWEGNLHREEKVRRRAYQLWEDAGRPDGRSDEFWLAAEMDILGKVDNSIAFDPFEPPIEELPRTTVDWDTS